MKLNEIKDNDGARKDKMRVGRGIGSGKGKTAGRGYKGQKSRTGVAIKGFEGGQMPLHRRLPKRGFNPLDRVENETVNLNELARAVKAKLLDGKKAINREALVKAGIVRNNEAPIKLLAKGAIDVALNLEVCKASKTAIEAVEKAGGSVKLAEVKVRPEKTNKYKKASA